MTELAADYPALAGARSAIGSIATELRQEHAALEQQMAVFLDADWTGRAAEAFRTAFGEWAAGAEVLLASLDDTGALIGAAMTLIQERDGDVDRSLGVLAHRLGLV